MTPIDDAVDQLRRHRGLSWVGDPYEYESATRIDIDIPVALPSRARLKGESETGVRSTERCTLVFKSDWPLRAPRPYLRPDFPLHLPHINPHQPGKLVSPCVFEGSLDELLHRYGLDAIVDQVIVWLGNAAGGTLIDLSHGWEPTRRDECPSFVVYSAAQVCAAAPIDGSILVTRASYGTSGGILFAYLSSALNAEAGITFSQTPSTKTPETSSGGRCAVIIARTPIIDDQHIVVASYQPETVVGLPSLFERAADCRIDEKKLSEALNDYYRRSILLPGQNYHEWKHGMYAVVVFAVQRPASLVGSPGRNIETLTYVVRHEVATDAPLEQSATVHPAFHLESLSAELLARTSGHPLDATSKRVVLLGCGSLGSKIGLHLSRGGFSNLTFVDNEDLSPHNLARHAVADDESLPMKANKALLMQAMHAKLSHTGGRNFGHDAVAVLQDAKTFAQTVPEDATLIVDATASLKVRAAAATSHLLGQSSARFSSCSMYGQGRCAVLMLEGPARSVRIDDLSALLFERCRSSAQLRAAVAGDTSELTRLFVGDNCRSMTVPMSDALISRSAAAITIQIERWLTNGLPSHAQLCLGTVDDEGIGMTWTRETVASVRSAYSKEDGGWEIRVLPGVMEAIQMDARRWGELETGGALLGRVSHGCRTISIAGLVEAPEDSIRQTSKFVLGTKGLVQNLKKANEDSLGHLMFLGTWHTHPQGGPHSDIDRATLETIAKDANGLPIVSLVWTPDGLRCIIDRW